MKRALITVSDKTGVEIIGKYLLDNSFQLYSTGGTLKYLQNMLESHSNCDNIKSVQEITNFPEILQGRVKTLHPKIYGGLLSIADNPEHLRDLQQQNISMFDLVIVNLYPFKQVVSANPDDFGLCIENIDIGGVSLIRASSKNFQQVSLLTSNEQYQEYMDTYPDIKINQKRGWAVRGFQITSEYDKLIHNYLVSQQSSENNNINEKPLQLKYGLNPHQTPSTVSQVLNDNNPAFNVLNGKLGYINVLDILHGWLTVRELEDVLNYPACISMKHTSPAGVGVGNQILEESCQIFGVPEDFKNNLTPTARAFIKSRNGDPLSSFGDFIGVSGTVDVMTAKLIKREICDGIVAVDFEEEALQILKSKKGGKFIIIKMNMDYYNTIMETGWTDTKELYGLKLSQPCNSYRFNVDDLKKMYPDSTDQQFLENKRVDFTLAFTVLKYAQSNNISMVYNGQVLGLGCGQQNRVGCVRLAGEKAFNWVFRHEPEVINYYKSLPSNLKRQEKVNQVYYYIENNYQNSNNGDSVNLMDTMKKYDITLGSDGFFPFPDNIEVAHQYGVKYIIQPGGSMADGVVKDACDKYGIRMYNTGKRMFYH